MASAQKQVRKGNWEKAIREYEKVLEADPDDVRSKLKVADLYVKLDDFESALQAYLGVARHYADDDIYEKAVAVYKQALRIAPESADLHRDLGEAYFRLGRLKDAVRVLHKAQKIFKSEQRNDAQRDVLERMVRIDPEDVGLKIQLAERYEKDELRDDAVELFKDAAEQLDEEGRLDEWVQVAERIVFLQKDDVELRKRIVRTYLDRRDDKRALKHLQYCFKSSPDDIETLRMLALTFKRLGKTQKSILVYKELANACLRQGQRRRALDAYRKVHDMAPDDPDAQRMLGEDLEDSGSMPGLQDTGSLESPTQTEDALDGVEFLDEDSAGRGADEFHDFAQEAVHSLGDEAHLSEIQEYPQAPSQEVVEATDLTDQIEVIEEDEEDISPEEQQSREVTQMLTESEVFLKYGLLDRAEDVISRAVSMVPEHLGAREQMAELRQKQGRLDEAADEYLEIARLIHSNPPRAAHFIDEARQLATDMSRVDDVAIALGLQGIEPQAGAAELSASFIEEISEGIEEASEGYEADSEPGAEEVVFLDDDEVEFLEEDEDVEDEDIHFISDEDLADIDFDAAMTSPADATEEELPVVDETVQDIPVMEDTAQDIGLTEETGELSGDFDITDADMVEVEVDVDDVDFDEDELAALDDGDFEDVDFEFGDEEADEMFAELFGPSSVELDSVGDLQDGDSEAELAEIDFYIERGMISEAEEALESFEEEHPQHGGVASRRTKLATAESGDHTLADADNPFGSESLSRKFTPGTEGQTEAVRQMLEPNEVVNTNLELGTTYKDMGLFAEAIEEFEQALDDPDAAPAARYQIALCRIEMGQESEAQDALSELAADQSAPKQLRKVAGDKLAELERAV